MLRATIKMRFLLVVVGKMKDSSIHAACKEYTARVRRHSKLDIREVRDSGRSDRQAVEARRDEGKALLRAVPAGARIVALTRTGVGETSSQLAKRLASWRDHGLDVAFVVGGAHGLSDEVLSRADLKMSISSLTLPHELARLVLLEQLYRVCTIWRGEPYHKGG